MSSFRIILVALSILAFPSAASAAGVGVVPWGETFCDPVQCVTPVPGTPERWTFKWGEERAIPAKDGWIQTYVFSRYHPNRSNHPWMTVEQRTYFPDNGGPSVPVTGSASIWQDPSLNSIQCGSLRFPETGSGHPVFEGEGPFVATEPALMHGCFPTVFNELGHWIVPTPKKPAAAPEKTPTAPTLSKAAACTPIVVASQRIAVTSTGLQCSSARNVLARFVKTGAEPRGWVCSRLAIGKARLATCGTPARSAKKIVGRWRL